MNPILSYFDLNSRTSSETSSIEDEDQSLPKGSTPSEPRTINPLPFGAPRYKSASKSKANAAPTISIWQQIIFYLGTVVGVLFSSSIMQFQAGKVSTISFTVITIGLSAIIALILMPFTYKKAIEPNAPFIIQLGLFVQTGVFWSVVFTLIGKAYG